MTIVPLGAPDDDRPEESFIAQDVLAHHAFQRGVHRRLGVRHRRVQRGLHLRRRTGEIGDKAVAGDLDRDVDLNRPVAEAVLVDVVGELVAPVGNRGDLGANPPLGVVENLVDKLLQPFDAVPVGEGEQPRLAAVTGGKLGVEVAHDDLGNAHVAGDDLEQRPVGLAAVVELEDRDLEPFLEDFRRVDGVAAGGASADVGIVRDAGGEANQSLGTKHRLEDEDVRQMHAAFVGIIHDEDVTGIDIAGELAGERLDGIRDRPEMHGDTKPLGDQPALRVAEPGRRNPCSREPPGSGPCGSR